MTCCPKTKVLSLWCKADDETQVYHKRYDTLNELAHKFSEFNRERFISLGLAQRIIYCAIRCDFFG
jgi:hypothetical protein